MIDRRRFLRAAGWGVMGAGVAGTGALAATTRFAGSSGTADPATCPVRNVVLLMMENRSFDHMLGRLPGVDGLRRDMFNVNADGERVYVHDQRQLLCTLGDPNHSRSSAVAQWNGGDNGGFVTDTGSQAMGYLSGRDIPWMYALAREYTVFDHWHCGILGPTWPNRSYLHAATSGGRTSNEMPRGSVGLPERTLWHQLSAAGVPWTVYFTDAPFTALYLDLVLRFPGNFKPISQFYTDALFGNLAPVCILEPGYFVGTDDHPPVSVGSGQKFMADVVTALQHGPQWKSTALFLTYDEHGGFYDHVAPPVLADDHAELGRPAGFRVPTMLVSPWARRGYVASRVHDHTSATKFVQWRFGLPPLTTRNATANDVLYAFDFTRPRTDLPQLPRPIVDEKLTALCLAGKFVGPDDALTVPGGEGPEDPRRWDASASLHQSNSARPYLQPSGTGSPGAGRQAQLVVPTDATGTPQPIVSGQPEFAEVLDARLLPSELDLRPKPGRPTPAPFLPAGAADGTPVWQQPNRSRRRHRTH